MVKFRILRAGNRAKGQTAAFNFRRADFSQFTDMLRAAPQNAALERSSGVLPDFQRSPPGSRVVYPSKQKNQAAEAEDLHGWTQSSWLKWNIKRKHTGGRSRVRSPWRNILSECAGNYNYFQPRLGKESTPAWTKHCVMIKIKSSFAFPLLFCTLF